MTLSRIFTPDPKLDLVLERVVDVPRELVWEAWTKPEHLKQWFCPMPWTVTECEVDLRPGGVFRTLMRGPEGQQQPGIGCYLEIVPRERLVWTDALLPGYRPAQDPFMTAVVELDDAPSGTLYRATALHRDQAARDRHEQMGFYEGWSAALDQLVALAKRM